MALWAADCAERVLPHFEEEHPEDDRPQEAPSKPGAPGRWEIAISGVRTAAFAAHAARDVDGAAAGHAAATAHVATHAPHAADYAVKAVTDCATPIDPAAEERARQYRRLPEHLRPVAFPVRGDG